MNSHTTDCCWILFCAVGPIRWRPETMTAKSMTATKHVHDGHKVHRAPFWLWTIFLLLFSDRKCMWMSLIGRQSLPCGRHWHYTLLSYLYVAVIDLAIMDRHVAVMVCGRRRRSLCCRCECLLCRPDGASESVVWLCSESKRSWKSKEMHVAGECEDVWCTWPTSEQHRTRCVSNIRRHK